jgi:hypothetical protein
MQRHVGGMYSDPSGMTQTNRVAPTAVRGVLRPMKLTAWLLLHLALLFLCCCFFRARLLADEVRSATVSYLSVVKGAEGGVTKLSVPRFHLHPALQRAYKAAEAAWRQVRRMTSGSWVGGVMTWESHPVTATSVSHTTGRHCLPHPGVGVWESIQQVQEASTGRCCQSSMQITIHRVQRVVHCLLEGCSRSEQHAAGVCGKS